MKRFHFVSSVDEKEFVHVEENAAGVGEAVFGGVGGEARLFGFCGRAAEGEFEGAFERRGAWCHALHMGQSRRST